MSQVFEPEDDPDTSIYVPKYVGKSKARAAAKRTRPVESSDDEIVFEPYQELKEIPYKIKIFNAMYQDTCSPTDWDGNIRKWTLKSGALDQVRLGHALSQGDVPMFAIRTADQAASTPPDMVLTQSDWESLVKKANAVEEAIHKISQDGPNSKTKTLKSLLPFTVVVIERNVGPSLSIQHDTKH
jgi:hypothetical protein